MINGIVPQQEIKVFREAAQISDTMALDLKGVSAEHWRGVPPESRMPVKRVNDALAKADLDQVGQWLVVEVCGVGSKLKELTAAKKWSPNYAGHRLKEALDGLVRYYEGNAG